MCRWLAYAGAPIYLDELIFKPKHSLIDQSLAARASETTTNGDGFGIAWYGSRPVPGLYRSVRPAWNDSNLRDLASQIESPLFLAHVRAATGTAVQQSNCHPFRFENWLFVHNGIIRDFDRLRRPLAFSVAPELYRNIEGTTDSEILFYLALSSGLREDPLGALERMAGLVERAGHEHGVEHPLHMTAGITDGRRMFAVRYSTERRSRTLFHSTDVEALRSMRPQLGAIADHTRVIVSEPLGDMTEMWEEVPESTALIVDEGTIVRREFQPC